MSEPDTELRLAYASDWHFGFRQPQDPLPEFDRSAHALLLAGDTFDGPKRPQIDRFLEHTAPTPVFLITGNHDLYKSRRDKALRTLRQAFEGTHVRLLDNEAVSFRGVTLIGTDLWTDFELFGTGEVKERSIRNARTQMNDFRQITFKNDTGLFRKLHPIDTINWHKSARSFIEQSLANADTSPVVLMTHHAPLPDSVPKDLEDTGLAAAYASDLSGTFNASGRWPDVIVHGHIHQSQHYRKGATQVLTNPCGYPQESWTGFDPAALIQFPEGFRSEN